MRTTHFLLASCLFFVPFSAAATAQEDISAAEELDFTLRRILPQHVYSEDLYQTLQSMYGRELYFEDRVVNNLALLEDSIVIYETEDRQSRILDAIAQLDINLEEGLTESGNQKPMKPGDMVLDSFVPRYLQSQEIYSIAEDLYGRSILVEDDWHNNLRLTNAGLLVYEHATEIVSLLAKLEHLDQSQAPQSQGQVVVQQYQPRHLSSHSLVQSLSPFHRSVRSEVNSRSSSPNISVLEERGTIVIRDFTENVEQIIATLESLDKPAPQVMVVCQVLHGIRGAATRPAPEDLQKQLRQLLPYESYHIDAHGMLRGSAVARTNMEIDMAANGSNGTSFKLELRVSAYDEETGALGLESCQLTMIDPVNGQHRMFSTSATIYKGEYAVLGVTGAEPLFLVVQLHPVQSTR